MPRHTVRDHSACMRCTTARDGNPGWLCNAKATLCPACLEWRNQMVVDNQGLIYLVVGQLSGQHHPYTEDLVQEGAFALIRAVELYCPSRAQFSTYAYHAIRHRLIRYLQRRRRSSTMQPRRAIAMANQRQLAEWPAGHRSSQSESQSLYPRIQRIISAMPDRYREVLLRRANGETLTQLAAAFGVSRQAMSQRYNHALRLVRDELQHN